MPNKISDDEISTILSDVEESINNEELTVSEYRTNIEITLELVFKKIAEEEEKVQENLTDEMRQWIQIAIFMTRKLLDVGYEKAMFLRRLEANGMGELLVKDIPGVDAIFRKNIQRISDSVDATEYEDILFSFESEIEKIRH